MSSCGFERVCSVKNKVPFSIWTAQVHILKLEVKHARVAPTHANKTDLRIYSCPLLLDQLPIYTLGHLQLFIILNGRSIAFFIQKICYNMS